MGPLDYLMIKFPGNKFSGKGAPKLLKFQKQAIIRVIDMVFIMKDANGKLVTSEAVDVPEETRLRSMNCQRIPANGSHKVIQKRSPLRCLTNRRLSTVLTTAVVVAWGRVSGLRWSKRHVLIHFS